MASGSIPNGKMEALTSIVGNMALAHEMIMNDNFQLKSISDSPQNSLEKSVHDIVHKAFWDVLEAEVNSEPPEYKNALNLLMEMKTLILEITPEKSQSITNEVTEYLDEDLISQQIEHSTFDIRDCASSVLTTLSKLCAPVRDEKISQLREETSLVSLLRGTFELINVMKMDIANYEINAVKPILMQQAVEYEKAKFMDYLKENQDGLRMTKIWLKDALAIIKKLQKPQSPAKITPGIVITHAYLSLMTRMPKQIIPETLLLDELRLVQMTNIFQKLTYVISILTYCLNSMSSHLSADQKFVYHLKDTIFILLEDNKWNEETMENVFLQVIAESTKECRAREIEIDPDADTSVLNRQLKDLLDPENRLKNLIQSRLRDYVLLSLTSQSLGPPTSAVLLPIKDELKEVTIRFVRVISHNKKVHYANYVQLVEELLNEEQTSSDNNLKLQGNSAVSDSHTGS